MSWCWRLSQPKSGTARETIIDSTQRMCTEKAATKVGQCSATARAVLAVIWTALQRSKLR